MGKKEEKKAEKKGEVIKRKERIQNKKKRGYRKYSCRKGEEKEESIMKKDEDERNSCKC